MNELLLYGAVIVTLLIAVVVAFALRDGGRGLSSEHHSELNRPGVAQARFGSLRDQYAGDSVAQQQIDTYDGSTPRHKHLRVFIDAVKSGDTATENREAEWLTSRYPDIDA